VSTPEPLRPFREQVAEDVAQVIAFRIGGELHACDVRLVEEVVTKRRVHRLPDMPARLLGVLRLRGDLVPVVDVAPLLDLALTAEQPAVVIAAVGDVRVGVAVDAAHEVVTLSPADYRPAPLTGGDRDQFVVGVARIDGTLVNLLDLAEMIREQPSASQA